jgi:hypothetical protein
MPSSLAVLNLHSFHFTQQPRTPGRKNPVLQITLGCLRGGIGTSGRLFLLPVLCQLLHRFRATFLLTRCFSILSGRPSAGTNNNDNGTNLSGALGLFLGQNQIQEATVVSPGYSGQFGGAAGANVSYVTKSGSTELHGTAQYYWNGTALNANSWFRNVFQAPAEFRGSLRS